MDKTQNNKAWFLVLPVLVVVAFSAVIPLMTVVNYSVNDTFGNNEFFWVGLEWFEEMVTSDRLHEALGRQILFSAIILAIEVPLGIYIALNMPKKGFWASVCLVLMALPLLIPFNVVGTIWQIFGRVDIGLGKRAAPPQLVEYVTQTLAKTLEHRAPVRSKTYRADARTFADQRSSPKGEPGKSARPIEPAGYKACRVRSQNACTSLLNT